MHAHPPAAALTRPKAIDRSAPTYELGDLLLSTLGLGPPQPSQRRQRRSRSSAILALEGGFILASRLALDRGELSPRVHDVVGGALLVASAGACYLCVCHALRVFPGRGQTQRVGELLLDRANPRSWPREKRRLVLEVCTWMATVLYSYTAFHWGYLTVVVGAGAAMMLAFISDFLAAYLRMLEARVDPQQMRGIGGMLWLKVALSYGCVGYIISDTGRNVHDYVLGGEDTKHTEEFKSEMVFNYLLITLVGASLIIVSELLLLCTPTRRAGILLQGRIVEFRKNWEMHPLRSLIEVIVTFGATTLYYNFSKDMLLSLQLGTCCGVLCILSSELLASASRPQFVTPPSPNMAVELPADHWVKLVPVVVMVLYFFYQVYAAIVRAASVSAGSWTLMLSFIAVAASTLTILALSVGTHMRVQLTATCALLFCLFLFTYASMVSLVSIYHYFDSIEAAFCLASFAGVFFLAASEMFLLWGPTREVGILLQRRVTNAKENWRLEPLRSFLELFTWFAVICGSFAMYDDLVLALQLGTFSGIAVTLSGEYFRKNRAKLIPWSVGLLGDSKIVAAPMSPIGLPHSNAEGAERARPLPVMLLFAYIGSGTFQWIFENMRSLEVTVLLATIAGIAFLCFADMLVLFKPTRWAGVILQDRFINVKFNWREYPVRSFVEFGCFLGVIYGSHAIYHDLIVAVQVGTLSGMLVTLGGEQVRSCARALPLNDEVKLEVEKTQILPLPVMSLLGLVGAVAFNIIYTHLRRIEVAFVLATTSGVIFALVGDMFVIWKPTRKVGVILQERLLYFKSNFSSHKRRSWMEVASLCGGWYLSYVFLWPRDLLIAVQFGTFVGIVACVCGELTMEYVAKTERQLMAGISARLALDSQKDSALLNLPYEVLFEVAHFLSAEDLLVARASCHKVDNMLKAESARFWLHASLRRKFRDHSLHRERSRAHNISYRMGNHARSLVYEAITLVLPKIVGSRDPAHVLTSSNEFNRGLKFTSGDVAFNVFRHMPNKGSLGIIVSRSEDFTIERVEVPTGIYDMIQQDPFSFVAAETLSTLEVFSNWHLAVVAFTTMTIIFIGQFSSDLLYAYIS
ncbi:hypothetical protein PHYBOEH_009285 [Phytophthora boehmeriae]|uniref:F-box domain-containing protein n=1 Tax=Phytophthora boehmeriae TaxID=109152 RepID=A0A8T1X0N5_9STRA|nr:hypothetical protein PHYBOEH_009285 [Phytophthora boehmeriae]